MDMALRNLRPEINIKATSPRAGKVLAVLCGSRTETYTRGSSKMTHSMETAS